MAITGAKGYLAMVLHAHLPFVRHPEHPRFMEEDWLFEAITETYIPLIDAYERMIQDGVDFRITMSCTPPLMCMLSDELLQYRYIEHLTRLIELAEKEVIRTKFEPVFNELAEMYLRRFKLCYQIFVEHYDRNLLNAFKKFQDLGKLEVITCTGTHGFFPLLLNQKAKDALLSVAVQTYEKHMGRKPRGIWLAECGFQPGDEELLKKHGIRYFFVDTHGILYGTPRPKYGVFAPVYTPCGVAAFGRDVESSKSVWSAEEGYPGDYNYREFYRDIGWDLELDYVKPYIHGNIRTNTGIKYYKITGRTALKEPYNEKKAMEMAGSHAANFMFNRDKQVEYLHDYMGHKPIIISPYDAELFGHWWYEGPNFIEFLLRKIHQASQAMKTITPSEYLDENPQNQVVTPCHSSWGYKGYSEVWLNGSNHWIYPHLHEAADRMIELANRFKQESGLRKRALNQAARELMLAQSSDWAFIMKTNTTVPYAVKRTEEHVENFNRLYGMIIRNEIDLKYLEDLSYRNNIFPDIDFRIYCD
ncbi:MAG: DUF1957 domain-containing protein [Candidatus Wallbacteria bacterium]|nr:DUF1957 domain-containing protein [Candidatus Wallbacteria bacterium]